MTLSDPSPPGPRRLAVLVACHNRRSLTERMLRSLLPQARNLSDIECRVFLLDDASSDGTAGMAGSQGPEVEVIEGDGQRFWSGGMDQAHRVAQPWHPDLYLMINDDLDLDDDALARLLNDYTRLATTGSRDPVVVGALRGEEDTVFYTGMNVRRRPLSFEFWRVFPTTVPVECDAICGNLVLLSGPLLDRIAPFGRFKHGHADLYLGLTARRLGHRCFVASGTFGTTVTHASKEFDPAAPLRDRLSAVRSPTGVRLRDQIIIAKLISPRRWPLMVAARYLRVIVPAPRTLLHRAVRRIEHIARRLPIRRASG